MQKSFYLAMLALTIAIACHIAFIFCFASNIPNADDYGLHLDFLYRFSQSQSFSECIRLIFERNGEHYVVLNKLVTIFWYEVFGNLNFQALIIFGNCALFVSLFVFFLELRGSLQERFIQLGIIALLFLQPQYVESTLWASGSIEHLWSPCLGLLFFHFEGRGTTKSLAFAIALGLLGTFTQGNGMVVFLVAGMLAMKRRDILRGVLFLVLFIVPLLVFAHEQQGALSSLSLAVILKKIIPYTLGLLGTSISPTFKLSVALGALLIIIHLIFLIFKDSKEQHFANAALLWLLCSAVVNAVARYPLGVQYGFLASRYHLVSILIVIILLMRVSAVLARKPLALSGVFLFSFIFFLSSYYHGIPEGILRKETLQDSIVKWQATNQGLESIVPDLAIAFLNNAIQAGIYKPPIITPSAMANFADLSSSPVLTQKFQSSIKEAIYAKNYLTVSGFAFSREENFKKALVFVILHGNSKDYFLSTLPRANPVFWKRKQAPLRSSFFLIADTRTIPDGRYRLGVVLKSESGIAIRLTHREISLEH